MRHCGPQRWVQELGVALIARHPGPQRDQTEIRDSLRVLFNSTVSSAPSERWLREHDPRGIVEQVKRTGGARHGRGELGVLGPQPAKWTDALIEPSGGLCTPTRPSGRPKPDSQSRPHRTA
jgi:hypothetical protein